MSIASLWQHSARTPAIGLSVHVLMESTVEEVVETNLIHTPLVSAQISKQIRKTSFYPGPPGRKTHVGFIGHGGHGHVVMRLGTDGAGPAPLIVLEDPFLHPAIGVLTIDAGLFQRGPPNAGHRSGPGRHVRSRVSTMKRRRLGWSDVGELYVGFGGNVFCLGWDLDLHGSCKGAFI